MTRTPASQDWKNLKFAGIAFVVLVVYSFTVAPSLTWSHRGSDGGDFITAAVTGRVPHPPGFPLYFLITRGLVTLFSGDPARVLNLFSTVMAVGAVVGLAMALRRLHISWWGTVGASLTLAFAPWWWSQALITEVYTSVACFASIALWLLTGVSGRRSWLGLGLVVGFAVSIHPTAILLIVLVAFEGCVAWSAFLCGMGLGLLPYVVLPLFGPWPQPWGDLQSFYGWWYFVTARLYWGNAFGLPFHRWPKRLLAWIVMLVRQFTPVGVLMMLVGCFEIWRRRKSWVVGGLLTVGMISLYAIGYNTVDSWVYLVAFLPLLAVPLGLGLDWLFAQGVPASLVLILPLTLLTLNWQAMTLHNDSSALSWLTDTLAQLPVDAVVLTERDDHTFALWYAIEAHTAPVDVRPDLLVVDTRFWGYDPYRLFLARYANVPVATPSELADSRPLCRIESQKVLCP